MIGSSGPVSSRPLRTVPTFGQTRPWHNVKSIYICTCRAVICRFCKGYRRCIIHFSDFSLHPTIACGVAMHCLLRTERKGQTRFANLTERWVCFLRAKPASFPSRTQRSMARPDHTRPLVCLLNLHLNFPRSITLTVPASRSTCTHNRIMVSQSDRSRSRSQSRSTRPHSTNRSRRRRRSEGAMTNFVRYRSPSLQPGEPRIVFRAALPQQRTAGSQQWRNPLDIEFRHGSSDDARSSRPDGQSAHNGDERLNSVTHRSWRASDTRRSRRRRRRSPAPAGPPEDYQSPSSMFPSDLFVNVSAPENGGGRMRVVVSIGVDRSEHGVSDDLAGSFAQYISASLKRICRGCYEYGRQHPLEPQFQGTFPQLVDQATASEGVYRRLREYFGTYTLDSARDWAGPPVTLSPDQITVTMSDRDTLNDDYFWAMRSRELAAYMAGSHVQHSEQRH